MVVQNTGNHLSVYIVSPPRSLQSLLEEIQHFRINIRLGSLHIDNKWGLHCKMSIACETAIYYNSLIHSFTRDIKNMTNHQ